MTERPASCSSHSFVCWLGSEVNSFFREMWPHDRVPASGKWMEVMLDWPPLKPGHSESSLCPLQSLFPSLPWSEGCMFLGSHILKIVGPLAAWVHEWLCGTRVKSHLSVSSFSLATLFLGSGPSGSWVVLWQPLFPASLSQYLGKAGALLNFVS